jgi:hypothetical protein
MTCRMLTSTLSILLMVSTTTLSLSAQDENRRGVTEAAVRAAVTDQEWFLVQKEGNPVKRVRRLLEIAMDRLRRAQPLASQEQYAEADMLVESYTTIISHAMAFIDDLPDSEHKRQRNAYKEFDLGMRKQIKTLQELTRSFPINHQAIEAAVFTAQRLRIIALNRFSGVEIIKVPEP